MRAASSRSASLLAAVLLGSLLLLAGATVSSAAEPSPGASPIPTPAASPVAGAMEFDTDRPGQDIDDFDLRVPDPAICDLACRQDPNCKAWTYVKPATVQGPEARCWLKDGIPDAVPNTCCVSGINPVEPSVESPAASPSTARVLDLVASWDATTIPGLSYPTGMDIAPDGRLYVVNGGAGEILVLDADGSVVRRFGEPGQGDGQLDFVRDKSDLGSAYGGVTVAPDGSIYVADTANRRVQQFDAHGEPVRHWGWSAAGTEPGTFIDPIDIAAAPDGTVYVVDDARDDIQHFSPDGNLIGAIGRHGTADGELNNTGSVFVDATGTLYNADWENDRVQAWAPDGSFLWSLGTHGDDPGEFRLPADMGVDGAGNLYVADRHRVQVFGPDRAYIGEWVAPGTTPEDELAGISVSKDGAVYVGAPWRGQIHVLRQADLSAAPASAAPRPTIGTAADDGARIVQVDTIDARTRDLIIDSPSVGSVKVRLLLPASFETEPDTTWPVLYLLHGAWGNHGDWTNLTDVEELTAPTDLLVVMPDAATGWYTDAWNDGAGGPPAWETFHTTELLQLLERNWRAGQDRVVAGLSMGGLGAMDYAARHPGMFKAAASFSGVMDTTGSDLDNGATTFGDPVAQADNWKAHNPLDLAAALEGTPLYVSYGDGQPGPLDPPGTPVSDLEVWIAPQNEAFVERLGELGIPVTVDAYGPGTHDWPYWERALHASLPMLLEALGE
jgi:diacylglycerol O-acyltransferase / trehalose O-mycolyltransferase